MRAAIEIQKTTVEAREWEIRPGLFAIFSTFFRIGLFTLGGGLAMATVMRHELVLKKQWLNDDEFMAEMSTSTLVPGAIAVNMAYLQGRLLHGKSGSAAAIMGTILPSIFIILMIAAFALPYFSNPRVAAFLKGCGIAVTGQLAFAGYIFGRKHLRNFKNALVCAFGLVIVAGFKFHPVWGVLAAGALGYFLCRNADEYEEQNEEQNKDDSQMQEKAAK
jgi:chromate transporter